MASEVIKIRERVMNSTGDYDTIYRETLASITKDKDGKPVQEHIDSIVASDDGVHGFRYNNTEETFEVYNSSTEEWESVATGGGGGGLAPLDVSDIRVLVSNGKVYLKWTDPNDTIVDGTPLVIWGGTKLIRKAGSFPSSVKDGVEVLDSKTRNAYQDEYFVDSGLSNDVTYYYQLFPYSTNKVYNISEINRISATPTLIPPGVVTNISQTVGNGRVSLKWTDPAATIVSDGVTLSTLAGTKVVYKTGSYPTNENDGTIAKNSTTRNEHASVALDITGLTNGTTYYFAFFPYSTEGAVNTDVSNRITAVPKRTKISTTPSQSGSLTYNGNAQSPTWNNYNSTQLALGGVTSGINATTYTATFTPTFDYEWEDGTTDPKEVTWTIGKATISSLPIQSGSLVFNGSAQSPSWNGYDAAKMSLAGVTNGTNAGDYTATFTPLSNYKWWDGATSAKNASWSIGKASYTLSINPTTITLNSATKSATIAVTRSGDGVISAVSNDTSVASVSVSGTTVTVNSVNDTTGTATITVSVAEGTNYTAPSSKTCAVTAQFLPAKAALNSMSWADIRAVVDAGQAANYWLVGDAKQITINGTIGSTAINKAVWVFILGFDHNSSREGSNKVHFQIGRTEQTYSTTNALCFTDSTYGSYNANNGSFTMNPAANSTNSKNAGGWNGSHMRSTVLGSDSTPTSPRANTFLAALPSDLRAVMKPCTKYTDNTGGGSDTASYVTATTDYLFLLAEWEVQGARTYANSAEQNYQQQYAYYSAGNSKIKYQMPSSGTLGSTATWWLRSAHATYATGFCRVSPSGTASNISSGYSFGVSPGFCV